MLLREKLAVRFHNQFRFTPANPSNSNSTRILIQGPRNRVRAAGADCESSSAACASTAAKMLRNHSHSSIELGHGKLCIALIVVMKINAAAVRRPTRSRHVPIELRCDHMRIAAVATHHIEIRRLVPLESVIISRVCDPLAVGRNRWRIVRPVAVRKLLHRAVCKRHFKYFRVRGLVVRIRAQVRGKNHRRPVRSPIELRSSAGHAAIGNVALAHLPWRAAIRGNHKNLRCARPQISQSIKTVNERIEHSRRIGPARTRWRLRKIRKTRARYGHARRKRNPFSVGRPRNIRGRVFEFRQPGSLARVHPADIKLRVTFISRKVCNAIPVRRPARRRVVVMAGSNRAVVRAVEIHDPQIRLAHV